MKELRSIVFTLVLVLCLPTFSSAELVVEEEVIPADEVEQTVVVDDSDDYYADEGEAYSADEPVIVNESNTIRRRKVIRRKRIVPREQAKKPTLENRLDTKLDQARGKLEDKLAEAIDKIEINVGGVAADKKEEPVAEVVEEAVVAEPAAQLVMPAPVYTVPNNNAIEAQLETAKKEDDLRIAVYPLFGLTGMSSDSFIEPETKYSIGIGIEGEFLQNIIVGIQYSYSQFEIQDSFAPVPFGFGNSADFNNFEYNQNVIDLGMKYAFGNRFSRIRPYLGAGAGYAMGYLNRTQEYIDSATRFNPGLSSAGVFDDYETTAWLGFLQGGVDFNFGKNFGLGLGARYYTVFSASGEGSYNNNASGAYGAYGALARPLTQEDVSKSTIGTSIQDSSFYSGLLHMKITF